MDQRRGRAWSGLDELDVESDCDVLADEDAAGFERSVPVEAEVLATDLCCGRQADACVAPRILARGAWAFDGKGDGLCYAMYGEVACDCVLLLTLLLDGRGLEGHGGKLLNVKEVRTFQMAVALRVSSGESADGDSGLDAAAFGAGAVLVEHAIKAAEAAFYIGNHHVFHLELGRRVSGVDLPGGNGGGRGGCGHGVAPFISMDAAGRYLLQQIISKSREWQKGSRRTKRGGCLIYRTAWAIVVLTFMSVSFISRKGIAVAGCILLLCFGMRPDA